MSNGQIGQQERTMLAVFAAGLIATIAVAGSLTPDPKGLGTHQQLGLPPCTSITVLGLRCPACGMTTSWALMMKGQIAQALAANIGGTMLFVVAFVSIPWLAWVIWTGDPKSREQWGVFALCATVASMLIAFVMWGWNFLSSVVM